jgi:hypothetical protein
MADLSSENLKEREKGSRLSIMIPQALNNSWSELLTSISGRNAHLVATHPSIRGMCAI